MILRPSLYLFVYELVVPSLVYVSLSVLYLTKKERKKRSNNKTTSEVNEFSNGDGHEYRVS